MYGVLYKRSCLFTILSLLKQLLCETLTANIYQYFKQNAYPANTLRKSNVVLRLYFGNLRSYFLLTLMLGNLNYVRNPNVVITLLSLCKICYVIMRNINIIKLIPFFNKVSSSKCTKYTIAQGKTSLLK